MDQAVAAPTGKDLRDSMQALSGHANWGQLSGRISTYEAGTRTVQTVPVNSFQFIPTQAGSFSNYRPHCRQLVVDEHPVLCSLACRACGHIGFGDRFLLGNLGRRQ